MPGGILREKMEYVKSVKIKMDFLPEQAGRENKGKREGREKSPNPTSTSKNRIAFDINAIRL